MWNFPPDLAVIDTRRSLVKLIIGFLKAFVQHFRSTNSDIRTDLCTHLCAGYPDDIFDDTLVL